jgi:hypothetical protein
MFRWTATSWLAVAGTFALLGFSIPVLAEDAAPQAGSLPSTSLGQPQSSPPSQLGKPTTTVPAPPLPAPVLPAPAQTAPAPAEPPQSAPVLPGLGGLMTPNGVPLPGGLGFIRPGADSVGIQINTPDGPFDITIPRRRRRARGQEPIAPEATTDAPLFGQAAKPGSTVNPAPAASLPDPGLENDRRLPGESGSPDIGRPSRGSREFAHLARLFHARNYPTVLRRLNRSLIRDPADRDLLQLRSLTELVLGDFHSASADALAVLAQDDVWDWATLRSLYHSADEYTAVYRGLEDRVVASPNAAELRLLLAYHNLMLGNRDAARRHFERVLALDPSNDVARRMIAVEQPPQPRAEPAHPEPARADAVRATSPSPAGPLTPIPGRTRSGSATPPAAGGPVSIDLGQPTPAAPQKPTEDTPAK